MGRGVLGGVGAHGAKLVDVKMLLVEPHALLLEEHGSLAVEFDGNSDGEHGEREHHDAEAGQNDIDKAFKEMLIHQEFCSLLKTELQGTLVATGTTEPV